MKRLTAQEPICMAAACRHLAMRVIEQAVRDLSGAAASPADQESARKFLSGSPMLYRWCEVANLNASRMVAGATKWMARSDGVASRSRTPDEASARHVRVGGCLTTQQATRPRDDVGEGALPGQINR